ncbi:HdeD family acid-resistance protein [Rubellicoccus peritrichatus]|uniref:HdeD family acid-resistance protein n=1 Tax=Rubellicoccus peritrichatus TaxID=3080537 RepID=A0AAQ3LGE1_9BACT|nr:HdeD family acid-resistance protein [Puniceicoccus sp. CR14]WOO43390.1 HdeD family acid-resistance protein [Puniceicoccus sp. CR14]
MPDKTTPVSVASLLGLTPEKLKKHAGVAQWLAIVFIILGIVAIILPGPFSLGIELFLGWLLLIGGILQAVSGFSSLGAKGWWIQLLSGLVSAIVGALFLMNPFKAVEILTMLLAAVFLTNGIFRIVYSFQATGAPGAGLAGLNGVFGIIIGVIVWAEWPTSATWFLGLLVGIDMLFFGMSLFTLASAAKKEAKG